VTLKPGLQVTQGHR